MQLAQNYGTDGKAIGDLMVQGIHQEAGAYSTYGCVSTGEKNYDRKRKGYQTTMIMIMIIPVITVIKVVINIILKNTKRTMVVDM